MIKKIPERYEWIGYKKRLDIPQVVMLRYWSLAKTSQEEADKYIKKWATNN